MLMKGFIEETEPDLKNGRKEITVSGVFSVTRREGMKTFTSVLYIREHLVKLQEKLMKDFWKNKNKYELYVKGPPGCGKTCFFYLWARLRSVVEKKRVLIVQFREKAACYIWIREPGGALWRMDGAVTASKLEQAVDGILERNRATPFDLCVHDGVIDRLSICNNMLSTLNTAIVNGIIKKNIHVTSLAFHLSTGGQYLGAGSAIEQASVDSWLRNEYVSAVSCQEFMNHFNVQGSVDVFHADKQWLKERSDPDDEENSNEAAEDGEMEYVGTADENVTLDDIIGAKYYLAGGSARFFFEYKLKDLKEQIDERCDRVTEDNWNYFAQGAVASATPSSVNTLMQQFQGKASPLSKYVLFRAYEKCKTDLVNSVKAAASSSNNPALKGWAFELEQIDFIRLSLESPPENPILVTNDSGLSFYPHSQATFDEKKFQTGTVKDDGTVIWCMKWNQGCFDVAFYQEKTLVTLQFTVSDEHSLKPKFIRRLRDSLLQEKQIQVDTFVHVGVSETQTFQFKLDSEGTGRQVVEEEPEFVIRAYHSTPLLKKTCRTAAFQANFSTQAFLEEVNMWKLANGEAKKRRRQ